MGILELSQVKEDHKMPMINVLNYFEDVSNIYIRTVSRLTHVLAVKFKF